MRQVCSELSKPPTRIHLAILLTIRIGMARQVVLVAKGNVQLKKDLREKKQDQSLICRFVSFAVGGNRWSLVHVRPLHIMMGLLTKSTIMNPESSFRNVERYTI